jgi:hypothetical protein
MNEKTRQVELRGVRYQIRRFSPQIGSFVLGWLVTAPSENSTQQAPNTESTEQRKPKKKLSNEANIRGVAMMAMLRGSNITRQTFVQQECMKVCSTIIDINGTELPEPVMTSEGVLVPELRDNLHACMRLQIEAIAFNLVDFFEQGGLEELSGITETE